MRLLFLLLLLANLAVFALLQWGGSITASRDAHPALHPERIALVGEPRAGQSGKSSPALAPVPAPATVPGPSAAASDTICMRWGPVPPAQLDSAVAALDQLQLGERLARVAQGTPRGPYWVYYPPLASKADADNKATELTNLGVRDLAVIRPPGQWQNAISLGLYAKQPVAEARLAELRSKGVQDARIEARGKTASVFALRDLDAAEQAKMAQLQQNFGGTQLQQVDCTQKTD